jgi:hypothetical protein
MRQTPQHDTGYTSLPGLEPYRPRLLYHLVGEARLKLHPMAEMRNLAEALFRLERSRTPADIAQVLGALGEVLQGENMQPLRRTITLWVRMLLRRKALKANMAEIESINDLLEANAMLEQTIERSGSWGQVLKYRTVRASAAW